MYLVLGNLIILSLHPGAWESISLHFTAIFNCQCFECISKLHFGYFGHISLLDRKDVKVPTKDHIKHL